MFRERPARLALLPLLVLPIAFLLAALGHAASAPSTPASPQTPTAPAVFLRINQVYVLYTHPKGPLWHGEPDPLASPEAGDLYVPLHTTAHLLGLYYDDDPRYTYPRLNRGLTVVHRGSRVRFSPVEDVRVFDAALGVSRTVRVRVRPYYVADRGDMMVPFHAWVSALRLHTNFTVYGSRARGSGPFRFAVRDYTIPGALWEGYFGPPFAFRPGFTDSADLVPSRFSLQEVVERQLGWPSDRVTVTLESLSGQRISADRLAVYILYRYFTDSSSFAGTHLLTPPDSPRPPSPCTVRGTSVTCTASFLPDPVVGRPFYLGGRARFILMWVMTPK